MEFKDDIRTSCSDHDYKLYTNILKPLEHDMIPKWKIDPTIELELKFGTQKNTPIDPIQFRHIINYLRSQNNKLTQEDSLDIMLDGQRLTITGLPNIKTYCASSDFSPIMKSISLMNKKREEDPKSFPEYNVRVTLSEETPINNLDSIDINTKYGDSQNKHYRYKKRFSFMIDSCNVRVDMTLVKEADGMTFARSGVLEKSEKYEIEIEFIHTSSETSPFSSVFVKWLSLFIATLQDSPSYMTLSDISSTLQKYYALIQMKPTDPFIGLDVMPLMIDNLKQIQNGYSVTEKADGTRYLLFINDNDQLYLIDRTKHIKYTGCHMISNISEQTSKIISAMIRQKQIQPKTQMYKNFRQSVFDGELIINKTTKQFEYLMFDCLYYNGKDLRGNPLCNADPKTLEILSTSTDKTTENRDGLLLNAYNNGTTPTLSRYLALILFDTNVTLQSDNGLTVRRKKYEFATDSSSIFPLVSKVDQLIKSYNYDCDGLVFTPYTLPYTNLKDKILKWKPINKLSNDFEVVFDDPHMRTIIYNGIRCIEAHIQVSQGPQLINFSTIPIRGRIPSIKLRINENGTPITFNTNQVISNRSVVEFIYDDAQPRGFKWVPIRVRYDKSRPNALNTAKINWKTIEYNIPIESLKTGNFDKLFKRYYAATGNKDVIKSMAIYHNMIKYYLYQYADHLIKEQSKDISNISIMDLACGRGGDLNKYSDIKASTVVGIDIDRGGIIEMKRRYDELIETLEAKLEAKNNSDKYPRKLVVVCGDVGRNVQDGSTCEWCSDHEDPDANSIISKDISELKATLASNGNESFDLVSCQFAIHYFTDTQERLDQFFSNVSQNLKHGGLFIGTTLDGKKVFDKLQKSKDGKIGEILQTPQGSKIMWNLIKMYKENEFLPIGQKINATIATIGQPIDEYLVNFDNLIKTAKNHGLEVKSVKSFGEFPQLLNDFDKNQSRYIPTLSQQEREYSYMNNMFIFQKP